MRAVDTNVVVRFLAQDDPDQTRRAVRAIAAGDIFVAISVILETEWVLRSTYKLPRAKLLEALHAFVRLPGVTVEDRNLVFQALARAEKGLDFADAIHLGRSAACAAFLSFDKPLAKRAARTDSIAVLEP